MAYLVCGRSFREKHRGDLIVERTWTEVLLREDIFEKVNGGEVFFKDRVKAEDVRISEKELKVQKSIPIPSRCTKKQFKPLPGDQ